MSMTTTRLSGSAVGVRGTLRAGRRMNWLLLGGVILMLAGRPVGGQEPTPKTSVDCCGGELSMAGVETDAPATYTRDAPSDARLLQRISPRVGARHTYMLTRNFGLSSADAASPDEVIRQSCARCSLVLLTPAQNSLVAFAAANINRRLAKLSTWSDQSGGGIYYPINATVGLFGDARTMMPNGTKYYGVVRSGLRVWF